MALINCPECEKEISDKADKCINCGSPLNAVSVAVPLQEELKTKKVITIKGLRAWDVLLTPFVFFVVSAVIAGLMVPKQYAIFQAIVFFIINIPPLILIKEKINIMLKLYLIIMFLIPLYISVVSFTTALNRSM